MEYLWEKQEQKLPTCDELSQILGVKVESLDRGDLIIGYQDDPQKSPITIQGVRINVSGTLTDAQLTILDKAINKLGVTRKGGKTITDEIDELKAKVAELEKKL